MKDEKIKKLKFYPTEKVELVRMKRNRAGYRFAITDYGRVVQYTKIMEEGEFKEPRVFSGKYPYPLVYWQRKVQLIHRLVAAHFLPKPAKDEIFVIHKDRNINNNQAANLAWVNKQGHLQHAMKGEHWRKLRGSHGNAKLTEDRVRMIRRKLKEGKTRMKIIAKQFGITEMQLYRIKSGENWGWLK